MSEEEKIIFKEGESVCHKENLKLEMIVSRILKESSEFIKGVNKDGSPIKEKGIRMIGIECHWWETNKEGEKKLQVHKFHSRELRRYNVEK
jgi:hypothetical protein